MLSQHSNSRFIAAILNHTDVARKCNVAWRLYAPVRNWVPRYRLHNSREMDLSDNNVQWTAWIGWDIDICLLRQLPVDNCVVSQTVKTNWRLCNSKRLDHITKLDFARLDDGEFCFQAVAWTIYWVSFSVRSNKYYILELVDNKLQRHKHTRDLKKAISGSEHKAEDGVDL